MDRKFEKGERVRMTAEGIEHGIHLKNQTKVRVKVEPNPCFTGVVCRKQYGDHVCVKLDGRKTPTYYHPDFWELDE